MNKNNSQEQKEQWTSIRGQKRLGSRFGKYMTSEQYKEHCDMRRQGKRKRNIGSSEAGHNHKQRIAQQREYHILIAFSRKDDTKHNLKFKNRQSLHA